jgi:hypothetical protein
MGEIKIHHFSHTKDTCDETVAFMAGLFQLLLQMIGENDRFYAPALVVRHDLPDTGMTEENVGNYVHIIPDHQKAVYPHIYEVAEGKQFAVKDISLVYNSKKQPEAILLSTGKSQLAIRVLPPPSCKVIKPKCYNNLSTLLFDAGDIDFHVLTSAEIRRELLVEKRWAWVYNRKTVEAHPYVYEKYLDNQKRMRERWEQQRQEREKERREWEQKDREWKKWLSTQSTPLSNLHQVPTPNAFSFPEKEEQEQMGYLEVKDRFTQQDEIIRDSFGTRWIQCEICSEIKPDTKFANYHWKVPFNLGKCSLCVRKSANKT